MKSFFEDLFRYSFTMNQQIIEELKQKEAAFSPKSLELLSHILNAQQIWNSRIKAQPEGTKVWELKPSDQLAAVNAANYEHSLAILREMDLDQNVHYQNSRGQEFNNTVRDILFHVINHSTYHRAQIATEMKQAGLAPLSTDYIFYKR